ncbi:beta transducin [Saxophila tyrrhenica]|uniref:Beta transducin n=1 Tax=Saxophila tyrrhenica TaxID=1690608 RepID=A0AAV9NY84_9PEZI|nr:beta transducin [Saxophila tyrrhenica]
MGGIKRKAGSDAPYRPAEKKVASLSLTAKKAAPSLQSKKAAPAASQAKKGGPGRVLKGGKKLLGNKITQSNASKSPLLALSAEIRNRIWDLVLSKGTIHINASPGKRGTRRTTAHGIDYPTYTGRRYNLALLESCQQIRLEAALLPFELNTFSFRNSKDLDHFTVTRILGQKKAILSITLGGSLKPGWIKLVEKMPNLEDLTFFYQKFATIRNESDRFKVIRGKLIEIFLALQPLDLIRVTTAICFGDPTRAYTTPKQLKPLYAELEAMIASEQQSDGVEENEAVVARK